MNWCLEDLLGRALVRKGEAKLGRSFQEYWGKATGGQ